MWFEAARTGDLDTLHICLFWGQRVDALADDGRTALSLAAELGHAAAVTLLLEHRADANAHGPGGARPLTAAVENEHWEIAAALIRGGADPNADGVAALVIVEPPKRQLLALMFQRGLDPHGAHAHWGPYIHFALNDAICADMFFGAGFDVARYEREMGESLLERALSGGSSRLLHLLSLGANVDLPVERRTGRTILMTLAAEEPAEQTDRLIRMLVKRGADLDRRDAAGLTAIDQARARGNVAAVRLLTRLRAEKARVAKRQAKARAAAEAKLIRERNAAAKKAAAVLRAAQAKTCEAGRKPGKPPHHPASGETMPQRGKTANDAASSKSMHGAAPERPRRSAPDQSESVESGAARGIEEPGEG